MILSDAMFMVKESTRSCPTFICRKACSTLIPSPTHCLHGLDVDLIILALASYELHFPFLQDVVTFTSKKTLGKQRLRSMNENIRCCKTSKETIPISIHMNFKRIFKYGLDEFKAAISYKF